MRYKYLQISCLGIGFFLLINFGCTSKESGSENKKDDNFRDSIIALIEKGRETGIQLEDRQKNLAKAYALTQEAQDESLRTDYLSRLSLAYLKLPDSALFRKTSREALDLAIKRHDTTMLAYAHWDLAFFHQHYNTIDSAFYHYKEGHKLFEALGNNYLAGRLLYNLAVIQSDIKDYTGSEITTIKAIELLKPLNKYSNLVDCYNNLGSITKEMGEYEKALQYYEMALDYQNKVVNGEVDHSCLIENNIGVLYQEWGRHKKAIEHFQKVLAQEKLLISNARLYAKTLSNMAYSQLQLGLLKTLPEPFLKAIKIQDSIEDWSGISRSYFNLAHFYASQADTLTAVENAQKAQHYAMLSNNNKRILETLELMTRIDPKNAATHTTSYIVLNDSLQREERRIRNKFARIQFETDEFIAQNVLLARQRIMWIAIAGGLFLLGLAVIIIIMQRVKNQNLRFQRQQQEANQEIFELMLSQKQKVEEGKQSEQKRISEELHDGVLGAMNGIRMVLLGLNKKADESAVAMRSEAISKLQEIQEEIRTISHELNHASYEKFHNFVLSIEDLIKTTGNAAKIKCTLNYDEDMDWDSLRGDTKINLYRITQEVLQNCVKHAGATQIMLDFDVEPETLKITIKDNGRGFNVRNGKKGIGHKNISSRVKKMNGTWEITSNPGEGTSVFLKIPRVEEMPGSIPEGTKHKQMQKV